MWTQITVRPYDEDHSVSPEGQALQPELSVGFPVVFVRDHWRIESRFDLGDVDLVSLEVQSALRLVPRDHGQIVYTEATLVNRNDSELRAGERCSSFLTPNV